MFDMGPGSSSKSKETKIITINKLSKEYLPFMTIDTRTGQEKQYWEKSDSNEFWHLSRSSTPSPPSSWSPTLLLCLMELPLVGKSLNLISRDWNLEPKCSCSRNTIDHFLHCQFLAMVRDIYNPQESFFLGSSRSSWTMQPTDKKNISR